MISLIAAHSSNKVIGRENTLPWYIPEDLKRFKDITSGHTVIMGRNTYLSIVERLHKPLPNRRNIVVSTTLPADTPGVEIAPSLETALETVKGDREVFIIGGQKLYEAALERKYIDRMYITLIDADIEGDAFFPGYNPTDWQIVERTDSKNQEFSYEFITYQRKDYK